MSIFKIRYIRMALVMLTSILTGTAASATAPWEVDPAEYRYDMSLYIDFLIEGEQADYARYTLAAFCGDECRGVAKPLETGDGSGCLYMRARSNEESGETLTFRYYDDETGESVTVEGFSFEFESETRLGYPSEPFVVDARTWYDVAVEAGEGGQVNAVNGRYVKGTELVLTAEPTEGHHFVRWSDGSTENPRVVTVDAPVSLVAEFGVNTYTATYILDGAVFAVIPVEYGADVPEPDVPEKEGYGFSGWFSAFVVMPAFDIDIEGRYEPNYYTITYMVDGEVYHEESFPCDSMIPSLPEPEKEGHTFSGWEGEPDFMPDHDVTVTGYFTINSYNLSLYLNGELYRSEMVEYDTPLEIAEPEVPEYCVFDGWTGDIPERMPAHDLDIYGTYTDYSSVEEIEESMSGSVDIYDLNGRLLYGGVSGDSLKTLLQPGLYLVNGRKLLIE